jgi:hypothetical protein
MARPSACFCTILWPLPTGHLNQESAIQLFAPGILPVLEEKACAATAKRMPGSFVEPATADGSCYGIKCMAIRQWNIGNGWGIRWC